MRKTAGEQRTMLCFSAVFAACTRSLTVQLTVDSMDLAGMVWVNSRIAYTMAYF